MPADKGNATVIMTREDYNTKLRGMLETATYRQLKKDLTAAQERDLMSRLGKHCSRERQQEIKYFELKNSWGCRPNSNYLLNQ